MNWHNVAESVRWRIEPFIGGEYVSSKSLKAFENVNPTTETVLCEASVGDAADVDRAVRVARARFDDGCWSGMPPPKRMEILSRLADMIVRHSRQLAIRDCLEMGKPIGAAIFDAQVYAPGLLRTWASFADKLLGSVAPLGMSTLAFNVYEPRGVIGAIAPWNFPTVNAVYKFGPALAAGNTVVLKPSEITSSSALLLGELAIEAGLPEGVLNIVPGLGSTVGRALTVHPGVDMLSFTGSTATGRKVMEGSAQSNGKPVLLECGGKSPQLIFEDVSDLDAAAQSIANDFLWNQGQVCSAHTRLLVQDSIVDDLLSKIVAVARERKPGDPLDEATDFGPLSSPAQRDRVKSYVEQGIQAGANPVLLGRIQESGGCYVWPTIFDGVERKMSIVREEIFGPVLCVQRFATEEEALFLANDTDYGLAATIWTRDSGRGRRLARSIRAAAISIRTSGTEEPDLGCMLGCEPKKSSGFGSELGLQGLQSYSTLKLISFAGA